MERKLELLSIKVTPKTKKAIIEYVRRDTHVNISDFVRSAIREKLKNDAPHLIEIVLSE